MCDSPSPKRNVVLVSGCFFFLFFFSSFSYIFFLFSFICSENNGRIIIFTWLFSGRKLTLLSLFFGYFQETVIILAKYCPSQGWGNHAALAPIQAWRCCLLPSSFLTSDSPSHLWGAWLPSPYFVPFRHLLLIGLWRSDEILKEPVLEIFPFWRKQFIRKQSWWERIFKDVRGDSWLIMIGFFL